MNCRRRDFKERKDKMAEWKNATDTFSEEGNTIQYKDLRHREWRESLYSVVMDVIEVCPAVFWGDVRLKKEYRRRY